MRGQRCSVSRIVKVVSTSFVDARPLVEYQCRRAVSWPIFLVRIAAPFFIPECFIKLASVSPGRCGGSITDPEFQEPLWVIVPQSESAPCYSSRAVVALTANHASRSRVSGLTLHLG